MVDSKTSVQLLAEQNIAIWYTNNPDSLSDIQTLIISSAVLPEGYSHITWQAAAQLMSMVTTDRVFLKDCLSPAIEQALGSAMRNHEWYRALGFMNLPWPDQQMLGT
jgi:hypothetical protein